jgi:S1-C subfamily serine protease
MKQKVVPTSPQSPHKQQREENREYRVGQARRPHIIFALLLSSLLIGASAGFAGFFVAANVPADWPVIGQYNIRELFQTQKQTVFLSTAERDKSVVDEAPQVIQQTAAVYNVLPRTGEKANLLGNAILLTSDGWMVAPTSIFPKNPDSAIVVLADGSTPEILSSQKDTSAGLTFFQVNSTDLSPVAFTDGTELATGQWVTVLEKNLGSYGVFERRIASEGSANVRETSVFNQTYQLDIVGEQHSPGSGVFNRDGRLTGIIDSSGNVVHASALQGQLQSLLETTQLEQIADDITYMQLSDVTTVEREERDLPSSGIWVIDPGEVGQEAGLQKDDVIVSINNVVVSDATDLSGALRSRQAESTFLLNISREDESTIIEYTTSKVAK